METDNASQEAGRTITDEELQMYAKYVTNAVEQKVPWSHADVIGVLRLIEALKKYKKRISVLEERLDDESRIQGTLGSSRRAQVQ